MKTLINTDIKVAETFLRAGKLVAIPTETVYGLAGNAMDENAVTEIFRVKNRPTFDPLIIHTDNLEKVQKWITFFPEKAMLLAQHLWAGALTLILPKKNSIPDLVTSGLPKVAVRIPNHPVTLKLLENLDFPLAAPSANPFGYISPTSAYHVENQLKNKIPMILDGGNCQVGVESTIIDCSEETPIILRKGGIEIETIENLIGKVKIQTHSSSNPSAPGMLKSHYAPRKPLIITSNILEKIQEFTTSKVAVLSFQRTIQHSSIYENLVLSSKGDLKESARNLFAFLRQLDNSDADVIVTEFVPERSLGRAINDRLRRASQN